jgi:hypothetical protein
MTNSLREVPKSVTVDAVRDFLDDVERFCGIDEKERISASLGWVKRQDEGGKS